MTLIACATWPDHAEMLTDTWSYTRNGASLGRTSKVATFPHLDMAVMTQGANLVFSQTWAVAASVLATDAVDFDDYLAQAPAAIAQTDAFARANLGEAVGAYGPATVVHVGWSPQMERFRAVAHASEDGFAARDLEGLFVFPSPLTMHPSDLELTRFAATIKAEPRSNDQANLDYLRALSVADAPTTPEQWADLAQQARARSYLPINTRLKVFVGGSAYLTRLERGSVTTGRLFDFDDSIAEMRRIMTGTMHPIGQVGPCPCGSGLTYRECCIESHIDEPCLCGSGQTMRACCAAPSSAPSRTGVLL
ncbi:MAG TPA: SEC-C domain-containing protein [Propionicimonas sp.]